MTYEEAHGYIEDLQRILTQYRFHFSKEFIDANAKAIEALEKQIAKKPQEKYEYMGNIGRGLNPMEYIKGYVCPTCGEWLDEFAHHCICGQAIDWSDDE